MVSRHAFVIGWLATGVVVASAVMLPATAADRGGPAVAEPEAVPVIPAAEALGHEGQERCVEMTVRAARKLPDKEVCFLNSRKNHRDDDNFTVVIFKAGLRRFREDGIENPALHFIDATIRVRGVVELREGRPQIVVQEPGQVTIVQTVEPAEGGR